MKLTPYLRPLLFTIASLVTLSNLSAVDGTWSQNASGNWSDSSFWVNGQIAGGASSTAVLLPNAPSSGLTVTIDGVSRTVGTVMVGDVVGTAGNMYIASTGGAGLIFNNGGAPANLYMGSPTAPSAVKGTVSISAPIFLEDSLNLNVVANTNVSRMTLSGPISATTAGLKTISNVSIATTGTTVISGAISNGAGTIALRQNSATSNMVIQGANSYSGGTIVSAGSLIVGNAGTLGSGNVSIAGGASLVTSNVATLDDSIVLTLDASALYVMNYTGTDTIASLSLDGGLTFVSGIWGALGSGAANQSSLLVGTGYLNAIPEPHTWALLVGAGLMFGFVLRRRTRQA